MKCPNCNKEELEEDYFDSYIRESPRCGSRFKANPDMGRL